MAHDANAETFDSLVVQRSRQVPVLVDFWAPWCGPCRALTPAIEKAVAERQGEIELVKVNSDENQDLAAHHGVRGIPDVRLFKDGAEVDRFVGALPPHEIRAFIRRHCPGAADRHLADGLAAREEDPPAARQAFEAALEVDGAFAAAHLELAKLDLAESKLDACRTHLRAISASDEAYSQAEALLAALDLASEATKIGDVASCEARLEAEGDDLEARFALGGHAVGRGHYRDALEHYLELARRDRKWRQETARKSMVTVFQIVGVREPLSEEFRRQLTQIYY